ncbi:methyl-accepting chemotaxis protein [Sporomusa aerivorans]|uniref:methyl-accepting chemotaxis protein n=1 Tax=Sporomusa aerivorans TaxID=204936 RepID=UPI00352B8A0B
MTRKRIPIVMQLGAMFGIAILLLMSAIGTLVYNYHKTAQEFGQLFNHTVVRTMVIKTAQNDFSSSLASARAYVNDSDNKFEKMAKADVAKSYEAIKDFTVTTKAAETRPEAEKLEKMLDEYIVLLEKLIVAKRTNDTGLGGMLTQGATLAGQIDQQFDKTVEAQDKTLKAKTSSLLADVSRDVILFLTLSVVASIAAIAMAAWYSLNTVKRIKNVQAELAAISNLDLSTAELKPARNDEIGDITVDLAAMKKALVAMVYQIKNNADTLAASSEELTATVEEQLRGTEAIAGTINEIATGSVQNTNHINDISAVVEQVSAGTETMSANAAEVNRNTFNAVADANNGVSLIQKVVEQNGTIETTMSGITRIAASLVKGSADIQEIVTVIRNIAGQTNLLALNAAIEAARAGEAGRGFAVVADEVRKLAEQSAAATNHIGEIIEKMTADISLAVQSVDAANKEVAAGKTVTSEAQRGYQAIIAKLGHVKAGIEQIALSVDETAKGMQTIVAGVQSISAVAEETTASTETVAASAEEQNASMQEINASADELAKRATELNGIVAQFRVK